MTAMFPMNLLLGIYPIFIYIYVCMYVCMYVRTYVRTYVCMYVYTHHVGSSVMSHCMPIITP